MKYKLQEEINNSLTIRTKNYLESDSFEEYHMNCTLMGIHLNKWRDAYWYRYLYFNYLGNFTNQAMEVFETICIAFAVTSGMVCLMGLILLKIPMIYISFPIFVFTLTPVFWSVNKLKTDKYIEKFKQNKGKCVLKI